MNTEDYQMKHKIVLVIGGASGIGRGICEVMASKGATIAIADIVENNAKEVENELTKDGYEAKAYQIDVTNSNNLDKIITKIITDFGQIDVLVNSAGRYIGAPGFNEIERLREEDWDIIFELNMMGTMLAIETVIPHMKKRKYGKIINIASQAGRTGSGTGNPAYSASKAAVINLTQSYAIELGPHNINVNAICPGDVFTSMTKRVTAWINEKNYNEKNIPDMKEITGRQIFEKRVKKRPLGKEQTPQDIGNVVNFLSSNEARSITGQSINVNNGTIMN